MESSSRTLFIACLSMACGLALAFDFQDTQEFIPSFPTGRIINGQDAEPHSAPFIISLSSAENKSHICGGTIIAKDWVVTAAHCIKDPVGMGVVAGLHVRNSHDEKVQERVVDFGRVHHLYPGGVAPYDIALLHVSESFEFTRYVQPASLPALGEIPNGNVTLYGWGMTNPYNILLIPKTLQTVPTQIVDWDKCQEILPETAPLAETNVCSDSYGEGISACSGDSGGPLVQEVDGAPSELIGVVSWGYIPCGKKNMPSVYTRVSAYIDWITSVMNAYYTLY